MNTPALEVLRQKIAAMGPGAAATHAAMNAPPAATPPTPPAAKPAAKPAAPDTGRADRLKALGPAQAEAGRPLDPSVAELPNTAGFSSGDRLGTLALRARNAFFNPTTAGAIEGVTGPYKEIPHAVKSVAAPVIRAMNPGPTPDQLMVHQFMNPPKPGAP